MYYLNSRYYDPEIGRFVNADDISFLDPETINGLNIYAYCGSNPVIGYDPNGTWDWSTFWKGLGSSIAILGGIALCFIPGTQSIGAALIIAGTSGPVGGIIGSATGIGFNSGWNIGTLIGGTIGLIISAPQLLSLSTTLVTPGIFSIGSAFSASVVATTVPIGTIAFGVSSIGLGILYARTSKSNGYWGEKWPGDHSPDHAHLKGEDGSNIRIDKYGKPLKGEPLLNSQQRKAINRLLEQIQKLFKRFGG